MKLKQFLLKAFLDQEPAAREELQLQEYEEHATACTQHSFIIFLDGPFTTGNCRFCDAPIEDHPKSNPFITIH